MPDIPVVHLSLPAEHFHHFKASGPFLDSLTSSVPVIAPPGCCTINWGRSHLLTGFSGSLHLSTYRYFLRCSGLVLYSAPGGFKGPRRVALTSLHSNPGMSISLSGHRLLWVHHSRFS